MKFLKVFINYLILITIGDLVLDEVKRQVKLKKKMEIALQESL